MLYIVFISISIYSVIEAAKVTFKDVSKNEIYNFENENLIFFTKHSFQFNSPSEHIHSITVLDSNNIATLTNGTNNLKECIIVNFHISEILKLRKILKHNTSNVSTIIFVFKDIQYFQQIQSSIGYLKLLPKKQVLIVRSTTDLGNLANTHYVTIDYSFDVNLPVRVNYNVHPLTEFNKEEKGLITGFYVQHYSQIALFFSLVNKTNQSNSDNYIFKIISQYKDTSINPNGDKSIMQNELLFNESRNVEDQLIRLKTLYKKERFKLDLSPVLFTKKDFTNKFGSDITNQLSQLYFLHCEQLSNINFDGEVCGKTHHLASIVAWKVIDECLNISPTIQNAKAFDLNVFKLKIYSYINDNYNISQQDNVDTNLKSWTDDILKYFKYLNQSNNTFNEQKAYSEIKKCTEEANLDFIDKINSKYKSIFSYIHQNNVFTIESLNFATHNDFWNSFNKINKDDFDYHIGRGMIKMDLPREACGINMGEFTAEYCDYLRRLDNPTVIGTDGGKLWMKALEIVLGLIIILFIGALIYLRYINSKLIRTTYRYIQMKTNRDSNVDLEDGNEVYK